MVVKFTTPGGTEVLDQRLPLRVQLAPFPLPLLFRLLEVHDLHHRAEASERDYRRSARGRKRSRLTQQLRQLGNVRRDAPRLVTAEQLGRRAPPRLLMRAPARWRP
jgi:hypothetical protein